MASRTPSAKQVASVELTLADRAAIVLGHTASNLQDNAVVLTEGTAVAYRAQRARSNVQARLAAIAAAC